MNSAIFCSLLHLTRTLGVLEVIAEFVKALLLVLLRTTTTNVIGTFIELTSIQTLSKPAWPLVSCHVVVGFKFSLVIIHTLSVVD